MKKLIQEKYLTFKDLKEFRFPEKAFDYNKIKNVDDFWRWNVTDAANKSGLKPLPVKQIGDVILWLNTAAQQWNTLYGKFESKGENTMDVRKEIRKMVREQLIETIAKYKREKLVQPKVAKESPKISVDRDMTKEDDVKLNKQVEKDIEFAKEKKNTGVPTEKEWKRFRTAEEAPASPSSEEVKAAWDKVLEKFETDVEKLCEYSQKIDDKTLCELIKEVKAIYGSLNRESRERYKIIRMQDGFKPVYKRAVSLMQVSDKSKASDIEKIMKLAEKYIRLEIKKKYDTDTERIEDETKQAEKQLK